MSDNEASSDNEGRREDPQPEIDDTPSEQPSLRVSVRQQSVTRKIVAKKRYRTARRRRRKKKRRVSKFVLYAQSTITVISGR